MIGPFKLRSLFLDKIIKLNSFNSLLQKSGNYLENFGLGTISKDESKKHLLELIIKYCKNIKFFDLPEFDNQDNIYSALNLIKILDQNLNYLFIEFFDLNLNSNKISSILLKELDDYIIKFKKVKYLAFKEDFIEGRDLFLLKDYVKKFELYNIKIQSYDDLDTYNSYKHLNIVPLKYDAKYARSLNSLNESHSFHQQSPTDRVISQTNVCRQSSHRRGKEIRDILGLELGLE
uniref:Uncharacterized protein n=1 Tax=Rhizophagus irregularis (strain DAOM 181602 / DAOM 197198 / MUCL 43194) TaxID=747089 RepID=U9TZ86_RHIID